MTRITPGEAKTIARRVREAYGPEDLLAARDLPALLEGRLSDKAEWGMQKAVVKAAREGLLPHTDDPERLRFTAADACLWLDAAACGALAA